MRAILLITMACVVSLSGCQFLGSTPEVETSLEQARKRFEASLEDVASHSAKTSEATEASEEVLREIAAKLDQVIENTAPKRPRSGAANDQIADEGARTEGQGPSEAAGSNDVRTPDGQLVSAKAFIADHATHRFTFVGDINRKLADLGFLSHEIECLQEPDRHKLYDAWLSFQAPAASVKDTAPAQPVRARETYRCFNGVCYPVRGRR